MAKADSVHSTPRRSASKIKAKKSAKPAESEEQRNLRPAAVARTDDPAFALIAEKRAVDVAHCDAIDTEERAEGTSEAAYHLANEVDWKLARTVPTTLAGIAALLRFANEIEDEGGEWPFTDTIGRDGWHYQLRATMAAAIEALIKAQAGRAVQS